MCQTVREWAEEERRIGKNEGRAAIVRNLIRRGDTDKSIMQVAECSREYHLCDCPDCQRYYFA